MANIRDKTWYYLADSKSNEFLSALVVKKYQKWDLYTNIFLVIITSASVASWVIWKTFPEIWSLLIAVSQILTLTKPYFLFPRYVKVFGEKAINWQKHSFDIEKLWFDYENGTINDIEAGERYYELRELALSFDRVPDDIIFFDYRKEQLLAEETCSSFLNKI